MVSRDGPYREIWCYLCDQSVISVSATPNCSSICAATVGCSVYLLDADGRKAWKTPFALDHEAWATCISADGGTIVAGTACKKPADGSVYILDQRGDIVDQRNIGAPVWSVAVSRHGDVVAASSWNGTAYRWRRNGGSYQDDGALSLPGDGLYGVWLSPDGTQCAICSYNTGVFVLDGNWRTQKLIEDTNGAYNIAFAEGTGEFLVGTRNGSVLMATIDGTCRRTPPVTSRPICGVSASSDARLLALGGFDGRIYVSTPRGEVLWSHATDGEIWSVGMSGDGSLVYAGSGDHTIRLFENHCGSPALAEIEAAETAVKEVSGTIPDLSVSRLIRLYLKCGVVQYGATRLNDILMDASPHHKRRYLQELFLEDIEKYPHHWQSHYGLAEILRAENRAAEAAYHYQRAADSPPLRSTALAKAADCFSSLRLQSAASSCFQRAREQHLDSDAERVLYNQGRSYEDAGRWPEAARHYELLASWNVQYRDVLDRVQHMRNLHEPDAPHPSPKRVDYTGLTVSLLGPDTPRAHDVDTSLLGVVEARGAELVIPKGERDAMGEIVEGLAADHRFMRGMNGLGLDYSLEAFLKYDYSLPEDELKKFLETANLMLMLHGKVPSTTLDIGTATGRYPVFFTSRGAHAFGIDIEERAIEYAKSKLTEEERPRIELRVGDARELPYDECAFDLVTCMMGTFAHIPRSDQQRVANHVMRVLKPDGVATISTWDVDCEHLSYLSMYNESQKEAIRANSPTQRQMEGVLSSAGLVGVDIRPFCMLPQMVLYGLGLEKLEPADLHMAMRADAVARAMLPTRHGEMYLAWARKPS